MRPSPSKAPFLEPLPDRNRASLRLSSPRSLYRPFSPFSLVVSPSRRIFLILVSRSLASTSRLPPSSLSLATIQITLSRSVSLRAIGLLLPPRRSPSAHPPRLPGFYLSLASTRSLSGNERRNTLATFNRPALSSAYTYLAGCAPFPLPTLSSSSPSSSPPVLPHSTIPRAPPPSSDLPLLTSHLYHQHRI